MADSSSKGRKTLLEKEKLLVTSNFSYSHSVFKRLVLKTGKNQGLFGKGLIDVDYHLYACKTYKGMIAPFNLKKKLIALVAERSNILNVFCSLVNHGKQNRSNYSLTEHKALPCQF